jgi:hypothetical protein
LRELVDLREDIDPEREAYSSREALIVGLI